MTRLLFLFLLVSFAAQAQKGFTIRESKERKKAEIFYDDKFITAYCWFDSTEKPVLFPIKTLSGNTITRGYPVASRAGERTDHPHHLGLWLNYESVNGLDFWNNSTAIAPEKKPNYGSIRHQEILRANGTKTSALLKTRSNWVDNSGKVLLEEITTFVFTTKDGAIVIDRTSDLKAVAPEVIFKDVKDGMLGLRMARELEQPSKQEDTFVDASGIATTVKKLNNDGVTGLYVNKEGITGDDTWGKRSTWMCMNGIKNGEHVSIAIIDHPKNVGYPTYWHARGYGLFAANPLGRKVFSDGKEELNLKLLKDQSTTFRYRVVVASGTTNLSATTIDQLTSDFAKAK